jgi:hypothetical protein
LEKKDEVKKNVVLFQPPSIVSVFLLLPLFDLDSSMPMLYCRKDVAVDFPL